MTTFAQAFTVDCPMCGAKPNENCIRRDGKPASTLHNERLRAWKNVHEERPPEGTLDAEWYPTMEDDA